MDTYYFFFQAEDGIRDSSVTGVQTCALPISEGNVSSRHGRDVRRDKNDNHERREFRVDAKGNAAFRDEQGRDHRAGSRSRPVQSELGESVRSAADGGSGSGRSKAEIVTPASNSERQKKSARQRLNEHAPRVLARLESLC